MLSISALLLVLLACVAAGCMGDKIVGTWDGEKTGAAATFADDKTFTISAPLVSLSGTWAKEGGEYILYGSNNTKIGSAVFVGDTLRITIGGTISVTDDFVKRK
ncbi:hypothetical protein MsAg5_05950 [Methanosarcinaceae archaeon Ag5]|uniref:DUF5640 domain-containing protein n=1 Tax=Methanolapillus africanus TaxID=3028297 RepID=A0AAE4MJF5_9EURY|nr:hypothetical protein [Methanosarcinaceae archaeon Ag5]